MEELEALRRCREGDRAAFRLLVERYGDLVTRSAYLMTHDRALAEDLTQEAFLAAWRGLGTFDLKRPFRAWLLRILVNTWLNHRRRRRPPQASIDGAGPLPGPGPSPEKAAMLQETRSSVRRAIESLDERQRLILWLRYYAELSVPEIAGVLSCPLGTVKSRLHRALGELRARLQGQEIAYSQTGLHGEEIGGQK